MSRWLGLWRPVAGRARSDWAFLFAVWLLILSATTLLSAGALYAETVEVGGLRRALAEAPPEARGVSVRLSASPTELEQLDPLMRQTIADAFGAPGADVSLTVRSSSLQPAGAVAQGERRVLLSLGAYEQLARHATLRAGSWPVAGRLPAEVAIPAGTAEALGLVPGDRLGLADAATPGADPTAAVIEVAVVGIYEPDRDAAYWLGDPLELSGLVERDNTHLVGPLMLDPADMAAAPAVFARADVVWRGLPRVEQLRVNQLDQARARIGSLQRAVAVHLPAGRFVAVNSDLAAVLGGIDRSALVSRSGVVLITLQFGILAAYAVLLVGGILAERRRAEVALLRARGASAAEVGLIAVGEAAVLAVPAAVLAPLLALLVVAGIGNVGALGESGIIGSTDPGQATLAVALLSGALCILALSAPALLAEVDLARVRAALGRPLAQTAAQRLGLDLVLLALAVIGIVQLRSYGATLTPGAGGRLELDPLLVAAPAIALAAGAVLVVRFVPRLGEISEWIVRRGRGVLGSYTARQAARRPLRYTRSALLVVLAAALATFGALYSATWSQSQSDQAAYRAGADLRVTRTVHGGSRAEEMTQQLADLPGVERVAAAVRASLDVGRAVRRVDVLAVDPETLVDVADLPDASVAQARALLATLADERPRAAGLELPAGTRRLAVVVDADLQRLYAHEQPLDMATWPGIKLSPVVDLGATDTTRLPYQLAVFDGAQQRLVFDLAAADGGAPTNRPAQLVSVDMNLGSPVHAAGTLTVVRIEHSPSVSGDDWATLADAATLADWTVVFHRTGLPQPGQFGPTRFDFGGPTISFTERVPVPHCDQWFGGAVEAGCFDTIQDLYRWSAQQVFEALPAIASEQLLALTGTAIGEEVTVNWFASVPLRIVGSLPEFPSFEPASPFLIVDRASLNRLRNDRQLEAAPPTEWWIEASDEQHADIGAAALRPPIAAAEVINRAELTRTFQRDPIALGLVGALLLGSLSAAVFAALGLLVTAVVSARERLGEAALLRALGVSRRQIVSLLSIEQLALLGLGLPVGIALGGLIALLVLPNAPLNRSGAAVVPAAQIVVPWELLGIAVVGGLAVVLASVLAANREISRRPLVDVLRERED